MSSGPFRGIVTTFFHISWFICRHPQAGSRPTFSDLLQSLSIPEIKTELLHWTEEDAKTHPQAVVLGAPLEAGKDLYPDVQRAYHAKDMHGSDF